MDHKSTSRSAVYRHISHQHNWAATTIQRRWKGYKCRRKLWSYCGIFYVHMVLRVQCAIRQYLARQAMKRLWFKKVEKSVHKIHTLFYFWKSRRLRLIVRCAFMKKCIIKLQSAYRRRAAVRLFSLLRQIRKTKMATKIQSIIRRFLGYCHVERRRKLKEFLLHEFWNNNARPKELFLEDFTRPNAIDTMVHVLFLSSIQGEFITAYNKGKLLASGYQQSCSRHLLDQRNVLKSVNAHKIKKLSTQYPNIPIPLSGMFTPEGEADRLLAMMTNFVSKVSSWSKFDRTRQIHYTLLEQSIGMIACHNAFVSTMSPLYKGSTQSFARSVGEFVWQGYKLEEVIELLFVLSSWTSYSLIKPFDALMWKIDVLFFFCAFALAPDVLFNQKNTNYSQTEDPEQEQPPNMINITHCLTQHLSHIPLPNISQYMLHNNDQIDGPFVPYSRANSVDNLERQFSKFSALSLSTSFDDLPMAPSLSQSLDYEEWMKRKHVAKESEEKALIPEDEDGLNSNEFIIEETKINDESSVETTSQEPSNIPLDSFSIASSTKTTNSDEVFAHYSLPFYLNTAAQKSHHHHKTVKHPTTVLQQTLLRMWKLLHRARSLTLPGSSEAFECTHRYELLTSLVPRSMKEVYILRDINREIMIDIPMIAINSHLTRTNSFLSGGNVSSSKGTKGITRDSTASIRSGLLLDSIKQHQDQDDDSNSNGNSINGNNENVMSIKVRIRYKVILSGQVMYILGEIPPRENPPSNQKTKPHKRPSKTFRQASSSSNMNSSSGTKASFAIQYQQALTQFYDTVPCYPWPITPMVLFPHEVNHLANAHKLVSIHPYSSQTYKELARRLGSNQWLDYEKLLDYLQDTIEVTLQQSSSPPVSATGGGGGGGGGMLQYTPLESFVSYRMAEIHTRRQELLQSNQLRYLTQLIQRVYRGYLGRKRYAFVQHKRQEIQRRRYLAYKVLYKLLAMRRHHEAMAIRIQAVAKGCLWRKQLAILHAVAWRIQCAVRCLLARARVEAERRRQLHGAQAVEMLPFSGKMIQLDRIMATSQKTKTGPITFQLRIFRCGNNYRLEGLDAITGRIYAGHLYAQELKHLLGLYNDDVLRQQQSETTKKFSYSMVLLKQLQVQSWQHEKVCQFILQYVDVIPAIHRVSNALQASKCDTDLSLLVVYPPIVRCNKHSTVHSYSGNFGSDMLQLPSLGAKSVPIVRVANVEATMGLTSMDTAPTTLPFQPLSSATMILPRIQPPFKKEIFDHPAISIIQKELEDQRRSNSMRSVKKSIRDYNNNNKAKSNKTKKVMMSIL